MHFIYTVLSNEYPGGKTLEDILETSDCDMDYSCWQGMNILKVFNFHFVGCWQET